MFTSLFPLFMFRKVSYITQDCLPSGLTHTISWVFPYKSSIKTRPTGQSHRHSSSAGDPSSQVCQVDNKISCLGREILPCFPPMACLLKLNIFSLFLLFHLSLLPLQWNPCANLLFHLVTSFMVTGRINSTL